MYQKNSVCQCVTPVRYFVDGARVVQVATGSTRGVCTQCGHYVHVEAAPDVSPEDRIALARSRARTSQESYESAANTLQLPYCMLVELKTRANRARTELWDLVEARGREVAVTPTAPRP